MKLCQTTADLQEEVALAKAAGKSIGLVPTMGALHEGHGSLITAARKENELVIVSVLSIRHSLGRGRIWKPTRVLWKPTVYWRGKWGPISFLPLRLKKCIPVPI